MKNVYIQNNPGMKIYSVNDAEFAPYGRAVDLDCAELIEVAEKIGYPAEGSAYSPSLPDFEALAIHRVFGSDIYGEMPVQTGYCCGHNDTLNALEWHRDSEINIAVTDFVLLLARLDDIEDGKLDSAKVKAFYVKKGQCVEVYATSLHFCPCEVSSDGFGCVVVLPKGTNVPLEEEHSDKLLFRKNKWIICHESNTELVAKGVVPAITGENYVLKKG